MDCKATASGGLNTNSKGPAPLSGLLGPLHQNAEDCHSAWLAWISTLLTDRRWFALFAVDAERATFAASWPREAELPDALATFASRAARAQTPLQASPSSNTSSATEPNENDEISAIPLRGQSAQSWVLCVLGPGYTSAAERQALIRLCQWSAAQLPAQTRAAGSTRSTESDLAENVLQAVTHKSRAAIGNALANTLLGMSSARRVSVGVAGRQNIELLAVSGQSELDVHRQLSQSLKQAMQHCIDTCEPNETLTFSGVGSEPSTPTSALANLYSMNQSMPLSLLRVSAGAEIELVVLLEHPEKVVLVDGQLEAIRTAITPTAALFDLVDRHEATATERVLRRVRRVQSQLLKKKSQRRTQLTIAAALLGLIMTLFPVTHHVSGRVVIEAADQQVIVAPIGGHIASSHARAGDSVSQGQLLATLDTHDLQLEVDKWMSEQAKNTSAYSQALASHDRTELSRLRADADRIEAELNLVQQNLTRSEIRAPMSGVLLSGDLSQSLGAPVTTGDVLFEVGSSNRHRVVIKIDEQDVGFVKPEQFARVRMASVPHRLWQAKVDTVQPVAVAEKGASYFRLPATFDTAVSELRPGMEGVAKIEVGRRALIWVATHRPLSRLRYWLWKLGFSR
ncbi:MAG: efflux RND transporter periplasmic adaptor subunit [Gammaproteobacteria bacterium]|nr:efflux RND transporter periplasmic adaptor subunit [Gammaproteobacteria bacterium]